MPHHSKKQQHPSAAKKQTPVSQEDNLQAQQQFAQYHQIAQSLRNSEHKLGEYCRRMKARLGKAEGITATIREKKDSLLFNVLLVPAR